MADPTGAERTDQSPSVSHESIPEPALAGQDSSPGSQPPAARSAVAEASPIDGSSRDRPSGDESSPPADARSSRRWYQAPLSGAVGAYFGVMLSLTPSLLPRGGAIQGLVTGVAIAIGYGIGVLLWWFLRQFSEKEGVGPRALSIGWKILGLVAVVTIPIMLWWGYQQQNELFELLGKDPVAWTWVPITIVVAALIGAAIIGISRLIRRGARGLGRFLDRWLPARTARGLGILIVGVLTIMAIDGVLREGALSVADQLFKSSNADTSEGTVNPESDVTSGGPGSVMTWESLGRKGRDFIGGVTATEDLAAFSGEKPTNEPIRVYAGIESGDAETRAELAVRDLVNMGAFDRQLLAVGTTTGTGWVDEHAVDPLEYMYNGDTAIVSAQYSYLPSWLSFLVDKDRAAESGIELFEAVYSEWVDLPPDERPELVVFGESLGSFGAESAFSGLHDIENRTDAALFVGPPNSNPLWSRYVGDRDEGSREILPVYRQGEGLRFAGLPEDVANPATEWEQPRTLYLQHASDPIVWWSPALLFSEPDWLREEPGRDVLSTLRWMPVVTFLQISADMMSSTGYPAGHGHWYGENQVDAWASLIAPEGWTDEQTQELHELMAPDEPKS
jgi:uncharacterized membrane protein